MDSQRHFRVVLESKVIAARATAAAARAVSASAIDNTVSRTVFDNDGLGRGIQHVSIGDSALRDNNGAAGNEAGDGGCAILPGGAGGEDVAVAVLHRKAGAGNRLSGYRVQLGDRQRTQRFIEEG